MVAPDCSGHPLWRGEKRQHDGKDTQSNWRSPPRPAAKSAEQGSRITGAPRKSVEDERVLEGPIVARKRGNTCGAKGPCCLSWFQRNGRQGRNEKSAHRFAGPEKEPIRQGEG